MSLLLETIRVVDGQAVQPERHAQRMNRTLKNLYGVAPGSSRYHTLYDSANISEIISSCSPPPGSGTWKVRILYDKIIHRVEALPYSPAALESVALVDGTGIDYSVKWADRSDLHTLESRAHALGARQTLILVRDFITDFSYANAAFFDGLSWWTPTTPLLAGTRRDHLLETGRLCTAEISIHELYRYTLVSPVNAMLEPGELTFPVSEIIRDTTFHAVEGN